MTGAHTPSVADVLAFPSRVDRPMPGGGSYRDDRPGMDLRDYFAGQALIGFMSMLPHLRELRMKDGGDVTETAMAEQSYCIADAMLAARATSKEAQGNG